MNTWTEGLREPAAIDYADNERGAIEKLQELNEFYRQHRWPSEYSRTSHQLRSADARDLSFIPEESVHLIVTSPPYWTLKEYAPNARQLGAIEDYEKFLSELDKVWAEWRVAHISDESAALEGVSHFQSWGTRRTKSFLAQV
jgi:hypothetical protein